MSELWLGIALLTLVAVAFVLLPFLRAKKQTQQQDSEDRSEQNIEIFRERLSELEVEKSTGNLDETEFSTLKTELERNLLIDVGEAQEKQKQFYLTPQSIVTIVLLALLIPASSIWMYSQFGRAADLEISMQAPVDPFNGQEPTLEQAIAQLELELQTQPDNPEGWFILSTTYMNQGRIPEAVEGLKKVLELLPPESPQYAGVMGQYAQALFFLNDNKLTAEVQAEIDKILAIDPQEITALGLLGVDAFDNEDYEAALNYWLKALRNAEGQSAESFKSGVRSARARLIEQGKPVPEIPELDEETVALNVQVEIAPDLLSTVTPANDVFVFAREVGGRVPLAAVKLKVADLPMSIVLDDSKAMNPQMLLSSVSAVEIYARVSKSGGGPQAQPGDIYTSIGPVNVRGNSTPIILSMDKVVE